MLVPSSPPAADLMQSAMDCPMGDPQVSQQAQQDLAPCCRSSEGQLYPGLHQVKCGEQGEERGFCPSAPLWWGPTGSPASSSGALSTGQNWSCWSGARGGHSNDLRAGTPLLWGKAGRVGAVQPGGVRRLWGNFIASFQYLKGPTRKLDRDFWHGHVVTGEGVMALKWKRVDLD